MARESRGRGRSRPWRSRRGRGDHHNASPPPPPPPAAINPPSLQQSPLQGECQRLCPPNEEAERTRTNELSRFECATADFPELVAVKKYRRAAAGRDTYNAQDLRPAPVLLETLRHLFTKVLTWPKGGYNDEDDARPAEFLALYHFINDRIRSVRQDFTVQCIENKELVLALQQAACFYLVTGLRAVQLLGTLENQQDWSDKLNDEQLASALSQLLALYSMQEQAGQKGYCRVDAPELEAAGEFVTYDLLLHADDPQAVGWMLRKLSPRLRRLPPVQRALRTFVALQTDDFHRFSLEFDAMSLLERAAMLRPLPRIWTRSIKMMNKAFGKQDRFPLEELARWMLLAGINDDGEGGDQAEKLCKALNIQTQRHPPPSPPPALPTRVGGVDEATDSWETIDVVDGVAELVTKERTKPPSLGFAQFKLAPVHEKMDPELARMLVRDVAFRLEAVSATKEARSMTELIMKGGKRGSELD